MKAVVFAIDKPFVFHRGGDESLLQFGVFFFRKWQSKFGGDFGNGYPLCGNNGGGFLCVFGRGDNHLLTTLKVSQQPYYAYRCESY